MWLPEVAWSRSRCEYRISKGAASALTCEDAVASTDIPDVDVVLGADDDGGQYVEAVFEDDAETTIHLMTMWMIWTLVIHSIQELITEMMRRLKLFAFMTMLGKIQSAGSSLKEGR
jgi:hypothetical protein